MPLWASTNTHGNLDRHVYLAAAHMYSTGTRRQFPDSIQQLGIRIFTPAPVMAARRLLSNGTASQIAFWREGPSPDPPAERILCGRAITSQVVRFRIRGHRLAGCQ